MCKIEDEKAKQSDKTYSIYSLFRRGMTRVGDAFYKVRQIVTQFCRHETLSRWMAHRIRGKRRWFRDMKSRCSYDTESILTLSTFWARTKRNLIFAAKSFQNWFTSCFCCCMPLPSGIFPIFKVLVEIRTTWLPPETDFSLQQMCTNELMTVCISNWVFAEWLLLVRFAFIAYEILKLNCLMHSLMFQTCLKRTHLACLVTDEKFGFLCVQIIATKEKNALVLCAGDMAPVSSVVLEFTQR